MLNSSVLDIAIGVVFVFLLLSIFATAINEVILSFLNMRGKFLLQGIATLLDNSRTKQAVDNGLVSMIYNHGQVYGLFRGEFDLAKQGNLPSYIPAQNFAIALLDSVAQPFSEMPGPPASVIAAAPETITVPQAIAPAVMQITAGFKEAAKQLADDPKTAKVGVPLMSMITMAGNDALKLQKSVEDWFNSGMDRVSGHYKFTTQRLLLIIGLVIAITLNADTIHIIRQLSNDSTLRQTLVASATAAKAPTPATGQPAADQAAFQQQITSATNAFANVQSLGLPLGWSAEDEPKEISEYLSMILGWLLTAFAISLGAPFWFDTLNKIMVIRSTIKPTEKSQDEGSKDKQKTQ